MAQYIDKRDTYFADIARTAASQLAQQGELRREANAKQEATANALNMVLQENKERFAGVNIKVGKGGKLSGDVKEFWKRTAPTKEDYKDYSQQGINEQKSEIDEEKSKVMTDLARLESQMSIAGSSEEQEALQQTYANIVNRQKDRERFIDKGLSGERLKSYRYSEGLKGTKAKISIDPVDRKTTTKQEAINDYAKLDPRYLEMKASIAEALGMGANNTYAQRADDRRKFMNDISDKWGVKQTIEMEGGGKSTVDVTPGEVKNSETFTMPKSAGGGGGSRKSSDNIEDLVPARVATNEIPKIKKELEKNGEVTHKYSNGKPAIVRNKITGTRYQLDINGTPGVVLTSKKTQIKQRDAVVSGKTKTTNIRKK